MIFFRESNHNIFSIETILKIFFLEIIILDKNLKQTSENLYFFK